jgi:hypothetical protein
VKEYFARKEAKDLATDCMGFIQRWSDRVGGFSDGLGAVWARNIRAYYGNLFTGAASSDSSLDFEGEQGELVKMLVPQARSLNTQFLSLTTKQKLHFEPEAETSDALTMADTRVASALLKQIVRQENVDAQGYKMSEHCSLTGLGYMKVVWDMMKGKPRVADPTTGELIYTGGLDISSPTIFDVMFDFTQEDFEKMAWAVCRTMKNKWDLLAMYPHLEAEILKLPSIIKSSDSLLAWPEKLNEDLVYVYEFYHKSTPALPNGRMTLMSDSSTIYFDEENPYQTEDGAYIPIVQMKPEPVTACGWGYPFFSNILPMQEMLDTMFSAIASNNAANAVQAICSPIGNDISVMNINNLKFLSYKPMAGVPGGGKPEPLQLTQSSPETYKFLDLLKGHMMEVYNINSALRGTPPPGVTSGTAIATLTTNALEFSQNFSKSYYTSLEAAMKMAIYCYRNFVDEPMLVSMTGPNKKTIAKEFIGSDLETVKRVTCKIANPLMATAAGKFEVAQSLLNSGLITNPKKYFQVLEGAPIETLYEDEFDEGQLIQLENDDMREGQSVIALIDDTHDEHIRCHKALLYDPEIRRNSDLVGMITQHLASHYELQAQSAPQPPMPGPGVSGEAPAPLPQGLPAGAPPAEPADSLVNVSQQDGMGITPPAIGA